MRAKPILVLVFLAITGLVPLTPNALGQGAAYVEDFDSCSPPELPPCVGSPSQYGFTTDGSGIMRTVTYGLTGNAFSVNDTGGAGANPDSYFDFSDTEFNITESGNKLEFAAMLRDLPATGGLAWFQFNLEGPVTGTDKIIAIRVNDNGLVTAEVQLQGATGSTSGTLFTVAAKQWFNVTIENVVISSWEGGDASPSLAADFFFPDSEASVTLTTTTGGSILTATAPSLRVGTRDRVLDDVSSGNMVIDNIELVGAEAIPDTVAGPPIAAGAGVNVNGNIAGFDVDDSGSTIIIRESDQDSAQSNVTTISAVTMTNLSNPTDTGCSRLDGVMAEQSVVGYIQCSSGDPTHLFVKNATGLGDPNFDADCAGYCTSEISLSGFSPAGGDGALELGEIEDFPLSHTRHTFFFGDGQAHLAWAFSGFDCPAGYPCAGSQPGIIGINTFSNFDNVGDSRETEETAYGGVNKGAEDICIVPGAPDTARLIAAHEGSSTNRYLVTFTLDTEGLHAAMVNEGSYAGFTGSRGVSCTNVGDSKVLISLEKGSALDEAWLVNATTGIAYWPGLTGLDAPARGVAVSGDGKFFAVVDGSQIHVGNATTGNITGTATMPPLGTFVGLEMDRFGQTMWVATTKNVTRYTLTAFTTVIPCCFQAPPGGETPTPTGIGGGLVSQASTGFGVGTFGASIILTGLLFVALGGILIGFSVLIGAGLVALGGFLFGWGIGWIPTVAVLTIFLVGGVVGIIFLFKR